MPYTRDAAATNTAVVIRTGQTALLSVKVAQRAGAAAALFLQLFNTASITPGTTVPIAVVTIPAGSTIMDATVLKVAFSGTKGGAEFTTALGYCVTTTATGSTAPTAGQEPELIIRWEPLG
jgi:hypothetical protein